MKPLNDIRKSFKELHVPTSARLDEAISGEISRASVGTKHSTVPHPRANIWRTIMKSRTTRIAAAGVIIAAIGFLVAYPGPRERPGASEISEVTKSPGEMLTVMSLNIAYRKGGMSAVEKQYDKAFEMLGPRSTSISVKELLAEFNGS